MCIRDRYGVGKKGFTPETLKEILYQSAYYLDEYNPRYTGQLGHGCVDATAALKIDVSNLHPFTLKSNQVTDNTPVSYTHLDVYKRQVQSDLYLPMEIS